MPVPQFLTSLGLATKIGLGAATAVAAVGGAGVAGALPGPVQTTYEAVSPFSTDEPADDIDGETIIDETDDGTTDDGTTDGTDDGADDDGTDDTDGTTDDDGTDTTDGTVAPPTTNFGSWVSEQARQGGVDGQEISAAAHEKNEARKAEKAAADETDGTEKTREGNRRPGNNAGGKGQRSGR